MAPNSTMYSTYNFDKPLNQLIFPKGALSEIQKAMDAKDN